MKTYIKTKLTILSSLLLLFIGCNDELDINRDPDDLSADGVALATEFPTGITGIAGAQGSYMALVGGFWTQYWTQSNAANQYKAIDDFSILSTDGTIDGMWRNTYDALGDLRNVKTLANEEGNSKYYLMATVLEAYASQLLVDFFDQVPYAEANNALILNPQYQDGNIVYGLIIDDLNEALSRDLNSSVGNDPGVDDLIFGGDMDNWVAFANTLKLKLYLRQLNANPAVSSQITALLTQNNFLTVDASLNVFEDAPDKSNPLFETNERQLNTPTNLRASTTLHSYLIGNADPRLDAYYEAGNSLDQGDFNSTAAPNSISVVNLDPLTPVYFLSLEESLFMQAEAQLKFGSQALAASTYEAAVIESFTKNGFTTGSDFVGAGGAYEYPTAGSDDDKLEAIMMQKWISGFPGNGFESFFDQNRTGIPKVSTVAQSSETYVPGTLAYPVLGTTGGLFPERLPFASDSRTRNENAPALVDITVPVWWNN